MRCTVTGEPYTVFGYDGKQVRDNIHSADLVARVRGVPSRRRAPAAVYNLGGGRASATARCSRRSRSASEIAGRELRLDARATRRGSATTAGGSATSREFQRRLPGLAARRTASRTILREIHDAERRALDGAPRMKLSVVIPAHNEAGSIEPTRARRSSTTLDARGHRLRDRSSSTTRSTDGTARRRRARSAPSNPRVRCVALATTAAASASRCAPASSAFDGRRGGDRDGRRLRRPARPRRATTACSRRATTAPSARASCPAREVHDYPRLKLVINRLVNFGIRMLFRHGYNDTTNAFKAYRREVIETIQPLLSQPLQPDRRDAAEGDRPRPHLRDRARSRWTQPHGRRVEARRCRRWAAATCSSSSTSSSSTTSAAATTCGTSPPTPQVYTEELDKS